MRAYGNGISGVSSGVSSVSKWPTQRRTTVRRRTHKLTPRAWDDEINCTLTSNQTAGIAVGRRHCSLSVALLALTQISTSGVACAESQVLDTKMVLKRNMLLFNQRPDMATRLAPTFPSQKQKTDSTSSRLQKVEHLLCGLVH